MKLDHLHFTVILVVSPARNLPAYTDKEKGEGARTDDTNRIDSAYDNVSIIVLPMATTGTNNIVVLLLTSGK